MVSALLFTTKRIAFAKNEVNYTLPRSHPCSSFPKLSETLAFNKKVTESKFET